MWAAVEETRSQIISVLLEGAPSEHVVEVVELVVGVGVLDGSVEVDALILHFTTEETIEFAVNKDNHVSFLKARPLALTSVGSSGDGEQPVTDIQITEPADEDE